MRLPLLFIAYVLSGSLPLYAQKDSLATISPADSGYLSSFDKTRIYYEVRGKGKPVLLVHGFISDGKSWMGKPLYEGLLKNGYKVILLDMRGNGRSDKPRDSTAYDNDAEAKDIMALIDLLKIKEYAAIGYSRGSIITARLLVLDKRIKSAVMGGMGADFTDPQWPRRVSFYHALMGEDIPELKGVVDYVKKQGVDPIIMAYLQRSQPSTSKEALGAIEQPVLVISGDKDTENGSAADLAKLFTHSMRSTVPGDHGHAAGTMEFAAEVIRFLKTQQY